MNQPNKVQTVLDALDFFKKKMIEANQLRNAISQRFDSELRALREEKERGERPGLEGIPRSAQNMFYRDLISGEAKIYGAKQIFLDDQISAAYIHKNRHFQWVLAEAYENFEGFLTRLYAATGYVDQNFWPISDFGNVRIADIGFKDFDWFFKQAKTKKNKPESILAAFRSSFQNLKKIELKNALDLNVVFELVMISKLRHLIVHNAGHVEHKEEVVRRMLSEAAINTKDKDVLIARADNFFKNVKGTQDVHVFLLGHQISNAPFITVHNLTDLTEFLVSYAQLLTDETLRYLYVNGHVVGSAETSGPS